MTVSTTFPVEAGSHEPASTERRISRQFGDELQMMRILRSSRNQLQNQLPIRP